MQSFTLNLLDATHSERIENVHSFVGEDKSGSFGILAGHARMITVLVIGLARFRIDNDEYGYLAMPGAVLYFQNNVLTITTRHYLLDKDYRRVSAALQQQLLVEEEQLHVIKESLHRMEDEVLKRLWEMGRTGAA
jgi:F-type H+-transporting ATPase subunit epsilon